jgi:peptidyl-prolyl cis-trans isomerase SDCCAG10
LLSFGEEAEDDEEEVESVVKVLKLKPKSAHDVGDPNLLSKKVYETIEQPVVGSESESDSESEEEGEDLRSGKVTDENPDMNSIKSKLKKKKLDDESKFKRDVVDNSKRVEESRLSEKELKKYI